MGRTSATVRRCVLREDHPHAGGENGVGTIHHLTSIGPSPRGWGELKQARFYALNERTIPTRVGRTVIRCPDWGHSEDHPHAGGENCSAPASQGAAVGPSPRGWGELLAQFLSMRRVGTIPTRVGRTNMNTSRSLAYKDHPHAGGENHHAGRAGWRFTGPSPRGWGELPQPPVTPPAPWTIPTRVGRTIENGFNTTAPQDHPHAGGENPRSGCTVVMF